MPLLEFVAPGELYNQEDDERHYQECQERVGKVPDAKRTDGEGVD